MQHWRITLNEAIALYKSGDLTAKGAVRAWIRIRLKAGWITSLSAKEVCETLGISRSAFWRAIHELAEEGEIELDTPRSLRVKRVEPCPKAGTASQKLDEHPKIGTDVPKIGRASQNWDERSPEPSRGEGSGPSSNLYSDLYSTLSQGESVDFEDPGFLSYCQRRMAEAPFKIASPEAWLSKHAREYWYEFKQKYPAAPALAAADKERIEAAIAEGRLRDLYRSSVLGGWAVVRPNGRQQLAAEWLAEEAQCSR